MTKSVVKAAKKKKSSGVLKKIKKLLPSKIATSKKTKKNAKDTAIENSLLAKQMAANSRRSANPEVAVDPAHASGHRRLKI